MKSRSFIFLFLTLFLSKQSAGRDSFLYNEKGQLKLDTTLSISSAQYKTWTHAELNIVAYLSGIRIPELYLEGSVKPHGKNILIASFLVDSNDIKEIKVLNDTGGYAGAVTRGLKTIGKSISSQLKASSHSTSEAVYMGTYYVAVNFMLIDFYEELKNQKCVPIIKGTIPIIDRGVY